MAMDNHIYKIIVLAVDGRKISSPIPYQQHNESATSRNDALTKEALAC
jgi:hypothetical protein